MANLFASDVKLADPLKPALAGYNRQAQGSLTAALGSGLEQGRTSARASGRVMGDYAGKELGRASSLASRGIENSLTGSLGQTSLKDMLAAREHQKKLALAKEIGDLMSPSLAQEILGGLSQGVNTGTQGYSLYQALNQPSRGQGVAVPNAASYYDPEYGTITR